MRAVWYLSVTCLISFLMVVPSAYADSTRRIKAAFLLNFAKFVEWPDESDRDFVFCIYGDQDYSSVLRLFQAQSIRSRVTTGRIIQAVAEVHQCHVLFVPGSFDRHLSFIEADIGEAPILTVSEGEAGAVIQFVPDGEQLRFVINREIAQKRKLTVSSHLLKLAVEPQ